MNPLLQVVGSHRLRRVSLGAITVLVVAGVVLATAGLAYVTYAGAQHRSKTNQLVERDIVNGGLYADVRAAAAAEGAAMAASFALLSPELVADFDRVRADAESALSQLRQDALEADSEELGRIERYQAAHARVASGYREVLDLLISGDEAAAFALTIERDIPGEARSFNEEMEVAADDAAARLLAAQRDDEAVQTMWNRIVLAGAVTWAFFIFVGGFVMFRWVLRPIARVAAATRAVAAGDLMARVPAAGLKEIDNLSASFNMMAAQLQESMEQLSQAATTDGLTGLPNYRSLQDALTRELDRSLHSDRPLAVLMMDIDGFKLFNETHGRQKGDRVLRQVADALRKSLRGTATTGRPSDIVGRYGGDEFVAILPETDRDGAVSVANRILAVVSLERVLAERGGGLPFALSIGLAVFPDDGRNKEELLACADASLREAKQVSMHEVPRNIAQGQ